jgi:hypothetical protein
MRVEEEEEEEEEKEEKGTRENSYPSSFRANLLGHVGLYIHTHTYTHDGCISLEGIPSLWLVHSSYYFFSLLVFSSHRCGGRSYILRRRPTPTP